MIKGCACSPALTCPDCQTRFCFFHSSAHPDKSCWQYALRLRKATHQVEGGRGLKRGAGTGAVRATAKALLPDPVLFPFLHSPSGPSWPSPAVALAALPPRRRVAAATTSLARTVSTSGLLPFSPPLFLPPFLLPYFDLFLSSLPPVPLTSSFAPLPPMQVLALRSLVSRRALRHV
jgi:hypothetical protein